jgi:phosphatidylglycerol:prolipoprotein diacylglycerol transferase
MWLARRLARREGVPADTVYDLALWAIISGLVGARLWYVVENASRFYRGPDAPDSLLGAIGRTLNVSDGGLVFYGGIVLPIVVLVFWFRRRGLPALKMFDVLSPPAMLGLSFGRIGCFFNGCCFGRVCGWHFPLGVQRPKDGATWWFQVHEGLIDRGAAWSLPVHPTQLYCWAGALVICGLLLLLYRRKKREGDVLAGLLILYPLCRTGVEMLRTHEAEALIGPVSIAQAVSAAAFIIGIGMLLTRARRPLAQAYVAQAPSLPGPQGAGLGFLPLEAVRSSSSCAGPRDIPPAGPPGRPAPWP